MLTAICDRCGDQIPGYESKKHQLMIVDPREEKVRMYDLCDSCGPDFSDKLNDFIKGELD